MIVDEEVDEEEDDMPLALTTNLAECEEEPEAADRGESLTLRLGLGLAERFVNRCDDDDDDEDDDEDDDDDDDVNGVVRRL